LEVSEVKEEMDRDESLCPFFGEEFWPQKGAENAKKENKKIFCAFYVFLRLIYVLPAHAFDFHHEIGAVSFRRCLIARFEVTA
jgi:hypothetical protein